jgi:hypothetical protein
MARTGAGGAGDALLPAPLPGADGDSERELTADRLPMILDWHEEDPVSDYERHRNFVIAELQGNRNPLIDHPEWARTIDFAAAWA